MNAYYYTPEDVGRTEFAPGYFRLAHDNIYETFFPDTADCFVLPCDIMHFSDAELRALPYLTNNESKHVLFSIGEHPERPLPFDCLAFRTDFNTLLYSANPSSVTQPWPVEDLVRYVELPASGFTFDVHAQLWVSAPITSYTVESCLRAGLKVHDVRNNFFYGTLETKKDPRLADLRKTFLETMQQSRLVLVPRSRRGVNRYRFFEALAMGRMPVLLCDDCILPFADAPQWNDCILKIHETDAHLTGVYLKEFLRTHSDAELIERGRVGRAVWEQVLAPDVWEEVWGETVYARYHTSSQVESESAEAANVL